MNINIKNIEKLQVYKINKNNIIVENNIKQKGIIYIADISNAYIEDLFTLFKEGDIIYGYLLKTENFKRYYSLKLGHTTNFKNDICETGGGYLGIHFLLNKLEKKHKQ